MNQNESHLERQVSRPLTEAPAPGPAPEKKTERLEVRALPEKGFRRCGRMFGPDPIEDVFTPSEAETLKKEKQLRVRHLGTVAAEGAAPAAAGETPSGEPAVNTVNPKAPLIEPLKVSDEKLPDGKPSIAPPSDTKPETPDPKRK